MTTSGSCCPSTSSRWEIRPETAAGRRPLAAGPALTDSESVVNRREGPVVRPRGISLPARTVELGPSIHGWPASTGNSPYLRPIVTLYVTSGQRLGSGKEHEDDEAERRLPGRDWHDERQ